MNQHNTHILKIYNSYEVRFLVIQFDKELNDNLVNIIIDTYKYFKALNYEVKGALWYDFLTSKEKGLPYLIYDINVKETLDIVLSGLLAL